MSPSKLLAIPLIVMSLSAIAQNAPPASPRVRGGYGACSAPSSESRGDRFVSADTNHDGRLTRTEAQALPFVAKHFDMIDADRDGYVTPAEMRVARERFQAERRARCGGIGQDGSSG